MYYTQEQIDRKRQIIERKRYRNISRERNRIVENRDSSLPAVPERLRRDSFPDWIEDEIFSQLSTASSFYR